MPEIPEHCPTPDRPCQWERERYELREELRVMRETFAQFSQQISEIHSALAVGSERFKNSMAQAEAIATNSKKIHELDIKFGKMYDSAMVVQKIVFGAVGLVLVAVFGALVGLVVLK